MKKIFLICLILITILSFSAVQASENITDNAIDAVPDDGTLNKIETNENPLNDGEKQDRNISIKFPKEIVKNDYSEECWLDFENPDSETRNPVSIYIDGKFYRNYTVSWTMVHESPLSLPSDLSLGNHVLTVTLPENDQYNTQTLTHNYKIVNCKISIPDKSDSSSPGRIELKTVKGATGSLIVKINGKQYKTSALKYIDAYQTNYAQIQLTELKPGKYEIEAIYSGNSKFKKQSVKKTVTIDYTIYANDYFGFYGKYYNDTYYIGLPDDVKKLPIVTINGENFEVQKKYDGYFFANAYYFPIGKHTISITYPGDSIYPKKTINKTIEVYPRINILKPEDWKENAVVLELPKDAKGNLTVNINGEFYQTQKVNDGIAKINLDLPLQEYNIYAKYTESDYELFYEINRTVTIEPIIYCPDIVVYGNKITIQIDINNHSQGNVSYTLQYDLDPTSLNMTDGKANLTLDTLDLNLSYYMLKSAYRVYFTYEYGNYSKYFNAIFYVYPIPSKLTNAKDITMYYGDVSTYSVKVYGDYGIPVSLGEDSSIHIKIGSHSYQRDILDSVAKIKIGSDKKYLYRANGGYLSGKIKLLPGTYKITAYYHGAQITTKLVIKQPLSLKTVKVKKSAKKLVLQATLKNKKPIKNKQITFKFNGKTYKAKTDKKGIAKVTIKSNILKKLKVGKKITYQATYLEDTVKKTVKVLK